MSGAPSSWSVGAECCTLSTTAEAHDTNWSEWDDRYGLFLRTRCSVSPVSVDSDFRIKWWLVVSASFGSGTGAPRMGGKTERYSDRTHNILIGLFFVERAIGGGVYCLSQQNAAEGKGRGVRSTADHSEVDPVTTTSLKLAVTFFPSPMHQHHCRHLSQANLVIKSRGLQNG